MLAIIHNQGPIEKVLTVLRIVLTRAQLRRVLTVLGIIRKQNPIKEGTDSAWNNT